MGRGLGQVSRHGKGCAGPSMLLCPFLLWGEGPSQVGHNHLFPSVRGNLSSSGICRILAQDRGWGSLWGLSSKWLGGTLSGELCVLRGNQRQRSELWETHLPEDQEEEEPKMIKEVE